MTDTTGGVHGFPAVPTSFVGRDGPVREVAGLLERNRLVTVVGPGGAGKTRLACEVARAVAGRFADGAWLAELAPVQDPGLVAAAAAGVLGVREQPGVPLAEVLTRALSRRQLLLVLDNCEHVIGAAAELCAGLQRPDRCKKQSCGDALGAWGIRCGWMLSRWRGSLDAEAGEVVHGVIPIHVDVGQVRVFARS